MWRSRALFSLRGFCESSSIVSTQDISVGKLLEEKPLSRKLGLHKTEGRCTFRESLQVAAVSKLCLLTMSAGYRGSLRPVNNSSTRKKRAKDSLPASFSGSPGMRALNLCIFENWSSSFRISWKVRMRINTEVSHSATLEITLNSCPENSEKELGPRKQPSI